MSTRVKEGVSITVEADLRDAEPSDPEWSPYIQEVVYTGKQKITISGPDRYVQALWEAMQPTLEAIEEECKL